MADVTDEEVEAKREEVEGLRSDLADAQSDLAAQTAARENAVVMEQLDQEAERLQHELDNVNEQLAEEPSSPIQPPEPPPPPEPPAGDGE